MTGQQLQWQLHECRLRCVLTRTAEPGSRPQQGRPVGLLTAWLAAGAAFEDRATRWDRRQWPGADDRAAARDYLEQTPGGLDMLRHERPQLPGEGPVAALALLRAALHGGARLLF